MIAVEILSLTDTLMAFGIALGSLGAIATVSFAGEAVRHAVARSAHRNVNAHQKPQPRTAR